ncbi:MAG: ComEA family DNA-binding protein [Actinomycetia bacterium]|nr:ComEA family DNA-binding protein [Actinomycetes bacterium]MCH9762432.1 ComEA family DNA-binding protein [Actinomycetes bacterium]
MSIELPVERLRRRLGADTQADAGTQAEADAAGAEASDEQSDTSLSRWLPESASTGPSGWISTVRADPGRAGVVALGILGGVAVLVTVLSVLSDRPSAVVSAKLPPVEMVSSAAATPDKGAPDPAAPLVVSVIGLVNAPGLVTLPAGARIADALDAAGGALDGADLMGLNMARRIADGEQIVVGLGAPPGRPVEMGSSIVSDPSVSTAGPASAEKPSESNTLIDLNSATVDDLDTLPGVGPVTAAAIVAWRETNGRFDSVDQLGEVDGIGPARLDKLRDHARV